MEGIKKREINQEYIEYLVKWLKDKLESTHTKGYALGLSGGIDSAVCAALIKKAAPDTSVCLILPIKNKSEDVKDAWEFAKKIDIKTIEIDLTHEHEMMFQKTFSEFQNLEGEDFTSTKRMSDANLRARLRMSTIYTVANLANYLVVGTDNAAELYTGYFTKYGDGAVDILPLANLLKSEVYEMGKLLGVTENILNKKPSAGLWEDQTDEGEMGTTYAAIDAHLSGLQIEEKDLAIIERMHRNTEHKRNMPDRPTE